ncbi:Outer membrane protein, multidrug efflux system [Flavobacterium sp. 9R]|uniref:efflux transporter outer membrane subunit n=1 Tax=Flavobacterium sp. 9R TaxID=2653143 RepID=UPI0012EFD2A2|nr:efflux transporter outer membrane subunit [Flavobacterium sp. 9R]VXB31825.1 Outer membrane protein, multidrug efflux system [Flavobacterium sp. 9R]
MRNKYKIGLLLLTLSFLPISCLVGPKYKAPELQESMQYRMAQTADTTASILNVKWFDIFNDEVLKGLITKGIQNNYDLKIAISRLDQAKANLGFTKANVLPTFQYSGGVNTAETIFQPSTLVANMSWEIDFWGKLRHENRAVQNELLATEEARKTVMAGLVSDIATAYFQLRDLDNQLEITKQTLKTRQDSYVIITDRFKSGYTSELDKVQIEQQVAIAEAAIPNIKRQITVLENTISILIGQMPAPIERGKSNKEQLMVTNLPLSIPSTLLQNRPDVKRAELQYIAAHERIGVAQAMRFPSFNIAAFAGFASAKVGDLYDSGSYNQNASAGVVGPIFQFGKNRRRVEINRQIAEQSKLNYQKTYLVAVGEVENAIQNVTTFKEEFEARSRQVAAAKKNYELSYARYYNGYVSYLEVLDVQRSLFDAEISLSQLSQRQLTAMVQLYKALGGGWN